MSIEFSESECRNFYHCRTSGIINIQESELSNVTGSSVNSMPVSPRPVQALGYDSAVNVSTSTTSSPVHISSPFGFAPDVSSAPTQAPGPTTSGFCASSALTPPKFGSVQAPVQATFGSGAPSTSTSLSFLPLVMSQHLHVLHRLSQRKICLGVLIHFLQDAVLNGSDLMLVSGQHLLPLLLLQ
ncbi:PREDICTED: uncharacterized protein LOC104703975 [Camelina sativa]|uniref:Uncharacterized protein LOC104703975 n=1 Tax=Camelina sativa TaxID=90675 RepID=A0ABM0SZG9_CAMSA|nr:PREDICTED: uncharacterized protein LOC104703975 [Camelina sativa]